MDQQDLIELKEKIDSAKEKAAELTGRQKGLMKELKDDWECSTIAQAEKKIEAMETEVEQINDKIKKGVEELEEEYEL